MYSKKKYLNKHVISILVDIKILVKICNNVKLRLNYLSISYISSFSTEWKKDKVSSSLL